MTFSGVVDIDTGDILTSESSINAVVSLVNFDGTNTNVTAIADNPYSLGAYYIRSRPFLANGQVGQYAMILDTDWDAYDMTSVSVFGGIATTTKSISFDVRLRSQYASRLLVKAIDVIAMGIR